MFEYKGYKSAKLKFDKDAGVIHGKVAGIRDVVTFEAAGIETLEKEFQASVDDYLDMCAGEGIEPNKPC
jgi:predicted HicB family RNase H-like nuclease